MRRLTAASCHLLTHGGLPLAQSWLKSGPLVSPPWRVSEPLLASISAHRLARREVDRRTRRSCVTAFRRDTYVTLDDRALISRSIVLIERERALFHSLPRRPVRHGGCTKTGGKDVGGKIKS